MGAAQYALPIGWSGLAIGYRNVSKSQQIGSGRPGRCVVPSLCNVRNATVRLILS